MEHHNSHYKPQYGATLARIYHDMVSAILPQREIDRDLLTIEIRSFHEGMSFLTKTLPALGKSIDVSLANGTVLNTHGFRKKADTNLPRFMSELFSSVFRDDGVPWFATWYSDHLHAAKVICAEMDGAEASMCHTILKIQNMSAGVAPKRVTPEDVDCLERCYEGLGFNTTVLRHMRVLLNNKLELPKQELAWTWLREIGLSRKEIDRITVYRYLEDTPLISDDELNQRREASVVALRALRQVCYSFYKLNIPYTDEQEAKTLAGFVETDSEINFTVDNLANPDKVIHKYARRLICRVLANANPKSGLPRHGPGAVATGEKLPDKHHFSRFYTRLNSEFGYDEWFHCNMSHVCDSLQELQAMEVLETGTAKVVLVPKDSRGPRLISCEPLEYQWIQQSLMRVMVDTIEGHPWTKGRVNFADQSINRELALKGSRTFEYVTLDMKEASDRVSLDLVLSLFPDTWSRALYASRTPATLLPDNTIVHMKKFAPMGSAVCFPVEALVFWALSVSAIHITHQIPLRKAASMVYVYGDDIICDVNHHDVISNTLPKFGLMLNKDKCCIAGPFKESCGMDAYYGHPVTPTKIRSMWFDKPEPSAIASYVEYSNAFYRSGAFQTALYLEEELQYVLRRARMSAIPTVSGEKDPSCIAFVRQHERPIPKNRPLGCKMRINRKLQRVEVRGYSLESKSQMTKTTGWPFLLRKLTEMEAKSPDFYLRNLGACSLPTGQYPIAHRVRLKRAWTPIS